MDLKKIITLPLLMGCVTSYAYLPAHLEQFEQSNVCRNCDLTQIEFKSNQHDNAELSGSFLTKISVYNLIANYSNLTKTNWVYVTITRGEFRYSHFDDAKLNYVSISEASLINSSFINAIFDDAKLVNNDFSNADFTNASFKNADLSNSNLTNSNISSAQLKQMSSYECAILPDGSIFDNDGEYAC